MKHCHPLTTAACALPVLVTFAILWRAASVHPEAAPSGASQTIASVAGRTASSAAPAPVIAPESPAASVDHILDLPDTVRLKAATTLLLSLADQPEAAMQAARDLAQQDTSFTREHGSTLITMLTAGGDFTGAVTFAELGGPERPLWLGQALAAWATEDPALAAYAAITEFDGEGFPEIANIWARRDPAALAAFARTLPEGYPKTFALERLQSAAPE